jgi:ribosomal protein S18 acetylase RimI-like enzyme
VAEPAIRPATEQDVESIRTLTAEHFEGVSIDRNIEATFGELNHQSWHAHKWTDMCAVWERQGMGGTFVAEQDCQVVGYVQNAVHEHSAKGQILNIVVHRDLQARGLGRALIEHAMDWFRQIGLKHAQIETLEQNPVGQHLYPTCGFKEVARQIYYVTEL